MATDGTVNRWNADPVTHLPAYTAADERLLTSPLLMPGPAAAPFSARSGRRVNGAGLVVSVGGSPEAWTVTPGSGVIYGSAHSSSGGWPFALPNAKTENLPARPGSGLSRIDLIVARIYDTDVIGSGPREFKIERVASSPNASPSAPALPALSFELGRLVVPNSGTITVTQSTARTVAAGGILPVATTAEMDSLKTTGIAYAGLVVDNAQTNTLYRFNGTDFAPIQNQGTSVTTPTVDGSSGGPGLNPILRKFGYHNEITNSGGLVAITFPTEFPNGVLHISGTTMSGAPINPVINSAAFSRTGFTFIWPGYASTSVKFTYEAVGW